MRIGSGKLWGSCDEQRESVGHVCRVMNKKYERLFNNWRINLVAELIVFE